MKKTRIFAAGLMVLLAFTTAGCGKESEEEVFSEDLVPLDEEELEALEEGDQGDDQFEVMDEDMLVDDPEVDLEESSEETNKEASEEAKLERDRRSIQIKMRLFSIFMNMGIFHQII